MKLDDDTSMRLLLFLLCWLVVAPAFTAPVEAVKEKWRTPYDLYLTPREAYDMKIADPDGVLFVDVRTRGEVKYIGIADAVDAHIPVRFLREDFAWSAKSSTYRTRANPDFVAAIDKLLDAKGHSRQTPIILICQSGSRVPIAAKLLHGAGYKAVYTQYQGFEGVKATDGPDVGKRVVDGWKNADLPWSYQLDTDKMYFNFTP